MWPNYGQTIMTRDPSGGEARVDPVVDDSVMEDQVVDVSVLQHSVKATISFKICLFDSCEKKTIENKL